MPVEKSSGKRLSVHEALHCAPVQQMHPFIISMICKFTHSKQAISVFTEIESKY